MPQVQRIDPIVLPSEKVTVAAYCRVSTNSEDQANSYHTQIAYYTKLISENPDWELVDIYADRGISGTSMAKRDEFNRMLADCREGKIKRVLVKSVSRFARNTTELLQTTRELKDLGVVVVFEEQGYDTSQVLGEMQLAMYAMAAQEESHSISKNMRWSYQKRMSTGEFIGTVPPFGYDMFNGSLIPNEDAAVVKKIFSMYISGMGMDKIATVLNQDKNGNRKWNRTSIAFILKNERYAGNALLQKRFRTEVVPYTRKVNHGEVPQYLIQSSHESIISDDVFEKCQNLMLYRKDSRKKQEEHLFTHKIMCPQCIKLFKELTVCAKCGKKVTRRTDSRSAEPVSWKCAECGWLVRMSDAAFKAKVVEVMNALINNPGSAALDELPQEVIDLEGKRLLNEFHRALDSGQASEDELIKMVFQIGAANYRAMDSREAISARVISDYTKAKSSPDFQRELFQRTARRIRMSADGALSIELQNSKIISERN